jgi:hypothetical protein
MKAPSLARFALATSVIVGTLGALAAASVPSCETYQPPPTASINGLTDGILKDPTAPLVLTFSTPIDPSTLRLEIAPFNIDAYGNLPDEAPDAGSLDVLLSHTPTSDSHVKASLSADKMTLTLAAMPEAWLPIGPSLVLLIQPGLASTTNGAVLHYRERIPFSYPVACGGVHGTQFKSGAYFFLLQVDKPIGVELKVFAAIDVNAASGAFYGQFTAAVRNPDPTRCDPACTNGLVCELIPTESCVEVSTPPVSVTESTDFVAKAGAPNGYTFEMHGCAVDQGDAGAVNILTQPGTLNVASPAVSIDGLVLTAQFVPVDGGLVQASGSLTASKTYLGTTAIGTGSGTLSALSIPDAQAPKDLPQPGTENDAGSDAGDGGDASGPSDGGS